MGRRGVRRSDAFPLTWYAARTSRIGLGTSIAQIDPHPRQRGHDRDDARRPERRPAAPGAGRLGSPDHRGLVLAGRSPARSRAPASTSRCSGRSGRGRSRSRTRASSTRSPTRAPGWASRLADHPLLRSTCRSTSAPGSKNTRLALEVADGWMPRLRAHRAVRGDVRRAADRRAGLRHRGQRQHLRRRRPARGLPPGRSRWPGTSADRRPRRQLPLRRRRARRVRRTSPTTCRTCSSPGAARRRVERIPDELVDGTSLIGPPGRIRERLELWRASRVTTVVMWTCATMPSPKAVRRGGRPVTALAPTAGRVATAAQAPLSPGDRVLDHPARRPHPGPAGAGPGLDHAHVRRPRAAYLAEVGAGAARPASRSATGSRCSTRTTSSSCRRPSRSCAWGRSPCRSTPGWPTPSSPRLVRDSRPVARRDPGRRRLRPGRPCSATATPACFFTDGPAPADARAVAPWPEPGADATPFDVGALRRRLRGGHVLHVRHQASPRARSSPTATSARWRRRSRSTSGSPVADRPLVSLPISVSGAMLAGRAAVPAPRCSIRLLEQSTPELIAAAIRDYRPSYMASVPTVFKALLDYPAFDDLDLTCFARPSAGGLDAGQPDRAVPRAWAVGLRAGLRPHRVLPGSRPA